MVFHYILGTDILYLVFYKTWKEHLAEKRKQEIVFKRTNIA